MTIDNETLFPLYPHEHRLEDESLDELRPLLRDYFVIRDQRQRDFGVDVTIEVLIDGRATNHVSTVQVKARSGLRLNVDGTLSLAVESSNIEYLLGGAASLVVLYDAARKAFLWADVLEEVVALHRRGVEYARQGQITIRFHRSLNRANIADFRGHLLTRARAARELRLKVAGLEPGGYVHVDVHGRGTSSNDVEGSFLADGWRLAARGRLGDLEQMFGLLSSEARQSANVRLLMAHAHAASGQVVAAWGHLNEARRRSEQLSQDDRDLLEVIELGIENTLQRSQLPQLVERAAAIRKRASAPLRVQLDVEALRIEYATSHDPVNALHFVDRARALVDDASAALGPLHPSTRAARLLEIDLSGALLLMQYLKVMATWKLGDGSLGKQMRAGMTINEANSQLKAEFGGWLERNTIEQRASAEYPHASIELEKSELVVQLMLVRMASLLGSERGSEVRVSLDEAPAAELMLRLGSLRDRASTLRFDDVEARARLLIVELLDIADMHADMKREAEALIFQVLLAFGDVKFGRKRSG